MLDEVLKHTLKNGKNGVKNGIKNGVKNGAKNGAKNGNGNGIKNGINGSPISRSTQIHLKKTKKVTTTETFEEKVIDLYYKPQYLIKGSLKEAAEVGGKKALKASVDQHFTKLKFNKSPVGRRGQSLNMKAFGLHERELDPLITNKELDMKWDETMGSGTRIHGGEEYKYQPGSTELTKPSDISIGGQRTLMTKKLSQMRKGKDKVNVNRKKHYDYMKKEHPEWVEDYTAKNAQATMFNKHEAERRIAQGEKVPNKPQYVMFEHNTAIRSPRWNTIKGANVPWNTFVNRNPRARFFKDGLESFFYTHIKTRGNNWDLRTNTTNMKDIEVMELSTGKLLFTIPFPEEFVIGESFTKYVKQTDILKDLKKTATGYKG